MDFAALLGAAECPSEEFPLAGRPSFPVAFPIIAFSLNVLLVCFSVWGLNEADCGQICKPASFVGWASVFLLAHRLCRIPRGQTIEPLPALTPLILSFFIKSTMKTYLAGLSCQFGQLIRHIGIGTYLRPFIQN
jgi:hypothetical protein